MKLSVISSLYGSEPYLDELYRRTTAAAVAFAGTDYEIIWVNDGSPDQSLKRAVELSEADPRLSVIDLSRNFGHQKALMTGLAAASGDYLFLVDSDLEEEPEWLQRFAQQLQAKGCDVVFGVQAARKGGSLERWTGATFYRAFNLLTGLNLPQNLVTARLMRRRYVEALLAHEEREIFQAGLYLITGFDQQPCTVTKHSSSPTTYTLRRKVAEAVNSVTSFSVFPLVAIFYIGIAIFLLALAYTAYLVYYKLSYAAPLSGWASVMASIWLLGGLVISFIGVIGIYLSKVYIEAKRRPYTIVRQTYGQKKN